MRQRSHWLVPCILLFAAAALARSQALRSPSPRVNLDTGVLQGTHFGRGGNYSAFLGIPYAAPPTGQLRWKPPQPVAKWSGVRQATHFGAPCPQLRAAWFRYIGWKEDCLYLNVWTPRLSDRGKLPVLVYFHGGSNTRGYSQMTPLGPTLSRHSLVVVSANYRLGPFGFLADPALTAESSHHSSGNYGLLDQLQALQWVRDNISHFGGDPGHVTVMGQSSGAVDICLLMASPLATGLFQAAILESGECQSVFNEDIRTPISYNLISDTGEAEGERLVRDLGLATGPRLLEELRAVPAAEILKAWSKDPQLHFDAIVDGWIVPEQPAKIFAEGKQVPVPILIGSNADEATVFGHNDVKTVEEYRDYLHRDTGKHSNQEWREYPVKSDADVPAQYLKLQNDSFAYGTYSMAKAVARSGQKAYLYCFTYADTGKRAKLGAHHGEELFFLSDSFPPDWQYNRNDQQFGRLMRTYWTDFARTGDPNAPNLPNWPGYDEHANECFQLGSKVGVRPVDSHLPTLERIMQQILGEAPKGGLQSDLSPQ